MGDEDLREQARRAIGSPVEDAAHVHAKARAGEFDPELYRVLEDLGYSGTPLDFKAPGSFEAWCKSTSEWAPPWQRWATYLFLAVCVDKVEWGKTRVELSSYSSTTEASSAQTSLDHLRSWALCPCDLHLERFVLPRGFERWITTKSPVHNRRAWHAFRIAHAAAHSGARDLLERVGVPVANVIKPSFLLASAREAMIPALLGKQLPPFATDELYANPTFRDYVQQCIWSAGCKSCKGWNLALRGTNSQANPASGDTFTYTRVVCLSCNHSVQQSWED